MQAYGDANLVPIAVPEICWNVYIYIYIKSVKSESLPLTSSRMVFTKRSYMFKKSKIF